MATPKQIAANHLNAQLSTGPRTEAGKLTTRMNALKTGVHAQSHIIRGEDPEALAQLAAGYNAEFHPVTPRQRDLVDTLVHNEWKIRRLRDIETDLWEQQFGYNDEMFSNPNRTSHLHARQHQLATAFDDLEKRLENLQRRLHAYERSTARALKQLRDLQSGAGASACQPAEGRQPLDPTPPSPEIGFVPSSCVAQAFQPAMPAFEPACPQDSSPAPSLPEIGFVPSNSQPPAPSPELPIPGPQAPAPSPRPPARALILHADQEQPLGRNSRTRFAGEAILRQVAPPDLY
jgi:hypothetical protein